MTTANALLALIRLSWSSDLRHLQPKAPRVKYSVARKFGNEERAALVLYIVHTYEEIRERNIN